MFKLITRVRRYFAERSRQRNRRAINQALAESENVHEFKKNLEEDSRTMFGSPYNWD